MAASTNQLENLVLRQSVLGSRRLSNYLVAGAVSIGGIGFFLAGLSSYLNMDLLPIGDATNLIFIPQGVAMGFYGVAALLLSLYLWLTIYWDIGGGYNEFNQETAMVRVVRSGFPGKNREVEFSCRTEDVQSIRVDIKEGLNPRRVLYVRTKDRREVPLTRVGQPISLSELENQGAELARFLGVPLEGL
ncbi:MULTISPECIES: photosystem I assembly protein Ycf4 [Moorena]|uniref:Photosystem I assembly protein Ycf4 n=1 Tax=Moorena bouillonii PNG TaxID=568701 RepID=A0A1U7MYF0_9CYAN|nr:MULTISPECIES: photosystem I assembly protein Ycf4 [Moorena]NEO16772.1 photosystem I assembly protein Ycf4 [Moorena sp. SIO3E8]NEQ03350.1 photosystem I assembly protein Ycf4 [Moorena sp. SIO3F7]OLT58684.1 photosystem I assembly protein [Moorena bouillonii PNG]